VRRLQQQCLSCAQRWGNDKIQLKEADEVSYLVVGRKGRDFFRRRKLPMKGDLPGPTGDTAVQRAKDLAATLTDDFLSSRVDSVVLVYNQFRSIVSQKITIEPLLPVATTGSRCDRCRKHDRFLGPQLPNPCLRSEPGRFCFAFRHFQVRRPRCNPSTTGFHPISMRRCQHHRPDHEDGGAVRLVTGAILTDAIRCA